MKQKIMFDSTLETIVDFLKNYLEVSPLFAGLLMLLGSLWYVFHETNKLKSNFTFLWQRSKGDVVYDIILLLGMLMAVGGSTYIIYQIISGNLPNDWHTTQKEFNLSN